MLPPESQRNCFHGKTFGPEKVPRGEDLDSNGATRETLLEGTSKDVQGNGGDIKMRNKSIGYDEVDIDIRNGQTSVNQKCVRKKKDKKKFEGFGDLICENNNDTIGENIRSPEVDKCGLYFTVLTQKSEDESWA